MKKDSFILYADAYDSIRSLPDAQKGQLLDAIFLYHRCEELPGLDPVVEMAFSFIRRAFERDAAKYAERCEKARESARKRWDAIACERIKGNANDADNVPVPVPDPVPDPDNKHITCPQRADGPLPCPHQEIIDAYHRILPELRQVRSWGGTRESHLKSRWREDKKRQSVEWWVGLFEYVRECPFLMGVVDSNNGRKPFQADLGWILKPSNFVKVVEGNYHEG